MPSRFTVLTSVWLSCRRTSAETPMCDSSTAAIAMVNSFVTADWFVARPAREAIYSEFLNPLSQRQFHGRGSRLKRGLRERREDVTKGVTNHQKSCYQIVLDYE